MSGDSDAGMVAWVGLAVQAVGPTGGRPYEDWLAEVERVAVDLWLMSARGGTVARSAAELSTCTAVVGVLTSAGIDGGEAHARLVVRVPDATSGAAAERTYTTQELNGRRAREVFDRARTLVGQGVQLLVSGGSEQPRVLHIGGSGQRATGVTVVGSAPGSGPAADGPVAAPARQQDAAPPAEPAPAPPSVAGTTWEEGSVMVWRNIDRAWDKAYRTSCLLALRDRVVLDSAGFVLNLDELVTLAQESPDPDTPRGKDIIARYPA
ncbi:hypothetical protein ACH4XT_17125 [Streptomyces avidinii]|uniref:hypothetical protein n=1 Tax=Streptomyces avidinii TaxID=1895 RepID=UPI0037ABE9BE